MNRREAKGMSVCRFVTVMVLTAMARSVAGETLATPQSAPWMISVWDGDTLLGTFPAVEGASYPLPVCRDDLTIQGYLAEPFARHLGTMRASEASEIRPRAEGSGCELFVRRARYVEGPLKSPRVRRAPP
jgi:hypothetical protein